MIYFGFDEFVEEFIIENHPNLMLLCCDRAGLLPTAVVARVTLFNETMAIMFQ